MDVVLTTHTLWNEAPRIRHQVARLLRDAGHRVLFLERFGQFGRDRPGSLVEVEHGIWTCRGTRLLHHQLRVLPVLHRAEAAFVGPQIARIVAAWSGDSDFSVINFMHDGWYLRGSLPGRSITTIIHDDFEAQSRLPFDAHIGWSLSRTCQSSDRVLAVSVPLVERLSRWCKPELFLPWAVEPYRAPVNGGCDRRTLLFWGYVDNALDLSLIRAVAERRQDLRIELVGPTQTRGARERIVSELSGLANVTVQPPRVLSSIDDSSVLCGFLPYRRTRAIDAVSLANKSLQLLSRGLPLLISGMPRFLERPFIVRIDGDSGIDAAIDSVSAGFGSWQPGIRQFLEEESPHARLRQLGIGRNW
jgi:hypothetical protein